MKAHLRNGENAENDRLSFVQHHACCSTGISLCDELMHKRWPNGTLDTLALDGQRTHGFEMTLLINDMVESTILSGESFYI